MDVVTTGFKAPNLNDFRPSTFRGETPARRDLIEGRLPRGKLVVLAGAGDVGKSWLLLQLFEAINEGHRTLGRVFGGRVVHSGLPCVLLMGEDGFDSIDLRLKVIRKGAAGADHGFIFPAPDIGSMTLVQRDGYSGMVRPTDVLEWLDMQLGGLRASGELGFLGIDTLSTFLPIDANKPDEVQGAYALLTHLAQKHDVCIVLTHHLRKDAQGGERAAIRGSTALVDGARAAYTMHKGSDDDLSRATKATCIEDAVEVVFLTLVKNNLGLRRDPITLLRLANGTLLDISDRFGFDDPLDALVEVVAGLRAQGVIVTKTGKAGIDSHRSDDWPTSIRDLGRDKLQRKVQALINAGRLVVGEHGLRVPESALGITAAVTGVPRNASNGQEQGQEHGKVPVDALAA